MTPNLRHLRLALAVAEGGSASYAAEKLRISQPAVTQALAGLEDSFGQKLFDRGPRGLKPNEAGGKLIRRLERAFSRLDPALEAIAPRLVLTVTAAQLRALAAVTEAGNVTLAARHLGLAQPTVQRAVSQIESEAARPLFERTARGLRPLRPTRDLARAARLAFAEFEQARGDLAALIGGDGDHVAIGAMPLSRAAILGPALSRLHKRFPQVPVRVIDGPYPDLLAALLRGEAHVLIGALRFPPPPGEVEQIELFQDRLVIAHQPGHPLAGQSPDLDTLAPYPWIVGAPGSPSREHFERHFGPAAGQGAIETGSVILVREVLLSSDALSLVSERQIAPELARGTLAVLPLRPEGTERAIGLTLRRDFLPTPAQAALIQILREAAQTV